MSQRHHDTNTTGEEPNYDIRIDADELLADLASRVRDRAVDRSENRRWQREVVDPHPQYRTWVLQDTAAMRAYGEVMQWLHPEGPVLTGRCRNDDGTVDVRGLLRHLRRASRDTNERAGTFGNRQLMARERHRVYARIISLLRDDYEIGWPRLDDIGGNPLECDLP